MEGFVISQRYVAFEQYDKLESIFKLDWHDRLENNEHLTRRPKILDWHKKRDSLWSIENEHSVAVVFHCHVHLRHFVLEWMSAKNP